MIACRSVERRFDCETIRGAQVKKDGPGTACDGVLRGLTSHLTTQTGGFGEHIAPRV